MPRAIDVMPDLKQGISYVACGGEAPITYYNLSNLFIRFRIGIHLLG